MPLPPPPPAIHSLAPAVPGIRAYGGARGSVQVYVTWPGRVLQVFGEPPGLRWVPAARLLARVTFTDDPRLVWPAGPVHPAALSLRREPLVAGTCWLARNGPKHVRFAARGLRLAEGALPDVAGRTVALEVVPP